MKFAKIYIKLLENDIVKVFDNMLEIQMLQQALIDFSKSMFGATAYGVVDMARWDVHRMNKRMDQVFDKLGIERQSLIYSDLDENVLSQLLGAYNDR